MATMTQLDGCSQYQLQPRPNPVRLRSWDRRGGVVLAPAPPPSREPSLQSSSQYSEKADTQLPPVDRGIGAWKFLFGAFMIEAFLFGFPLNYGVFQSYYSTHPPYIGNTNLSTIGTFGTCFYFFGAPVATYLVRRYQQWQRVALYTGFTVSIVGLGAAGSARDFGSLLATQGAIFGLGILIMYYPIFNMLNEWFYERRGLALGIICASTGITGLFYPFALEVLLNKYGPAVTLRICAIALLVLCGPCLPLLKSRYPSYDGTEVPKTNWSFLKMPLFYFFALSGLLQGLGFYFPTIYLPSYATSFGLSSTIGALLLVIYSFAQVLGQLAFGYVSDMRVRRFWQDERVPVEILVFVSPLVSGISIFALWGLARSFVMLAAFAMMYGIFAGGFVVLWARMVCFDTLPPSSKREKEKKNLMIPQSTTLSSSDSALTLTTFSYFACMKGIGNVVTGPISSALLSPHVVHDGYGIGKFKGIVVFSGAVMMASAAVMVVWGVGKGLVGWCVRRRMGEEGCGCGCPA
ncbi:MAG: hypothetical protein Q9219_006061 [cf. Caloplaca sp. 3 TL-2023]